MFDSRKLILSPFTGHRKRKAWNKSREKCKPVETEGIYYDKEDV